MDGWMFRTHYIGYYNNCNFSNFNSNMELKTKLITIIIFWGVLCGVYIFAPDKTEKDYSSSEESVSETTEDYVERNRSYLDDKVYVTEKEDETQNITKTTKQQTSISYERDFILNTHTMKYHYPTCSEVNRMKEENKASYHGTIEGIEAQGYTPCGKCHPH